MHRALFLRIVDIVVDMDPFFQQRYDAAGVPGTPCLNEFELVCQLYRVVGYSPIQKVTAALRMLAYGCAADALDENLHMSETTVMQCMKR